MKEEKTLDISWGTILKITLTFFLFLIVYKIKEILTFVFFAAIISILFEPAILFFERKNIKRLVSVPIIYFSFFTLLGILIFFFSNPIFFEIQKFAKLIPDYFEKISPSLKKLGIEAFENFENFTKAFQEWLIKASASIFSALSAIFGGIFSTLTIFSLSFFLSLEEKGIEKLIKNFLPRGEREKILDVWKRCQDKVSSWFGIRILACFFVGIFTFLTLKIFKIDYAFSLSVLTGFLDLIPILGPIFAGAIITGFILMASFPKAVFFLVAFILIQQIESNILIPFLANRFIKMSPFLVLFSLLSGGKLFGFWGAILAIPLTAIIFEFLKEFLSEENL